MPLSLRRPTPGCVLVCAPVGVLETKLFSHESNEMSRESLYHLCACPPTPTPACFPHSSSTSTACKSFAVHPQPPWPPQRVRQRHLGHIYQNILRIQKQKFATLPPTPPCPRLPMRFLSPTSNHCPPDPLLHVPLYCVPIPWPVPCAALRLAVSAVCISHLPSLFLLLLLLLSS